MKNEAIAVLTKNEFALNFVRGDARVSHEIPVDKTSLRFVPTLTNREVTILEYLSHGDSSKEIASKLSISAFTVRTHRKNILQKTGAKNVAHLIQLAIVNGWIA